MQDFNFKSKKPSNKGLPDVSVLNTEGSDNEVIKEESPEGENKTPSPLGS